MIEIPQELIDFRDSLNGKTGSMKSACATLQGNVSSLSGATSTAQNGIDSNYDSSNKTVLLGSFSSLNNSLNQIGSSFAQLSGILTSVENLIDKVNDLESLKDEIEGLEGELSIAQSDNEDGKNSGKISQLNAEITEKKENFERLKNEAINDLASLRSQDISISVSASSSSSTSTIPSVTKGHIEQGVFTYKKYKIPYYIYVPDTGDSLEKLPVHMYLHGAGEMGSGILKRGLPKQLVDGEVNVPGIVICPQTGREEWYRDSTYQDALVELTNTVVNEYNGDSNKISISGHSAGANECYRLVKRYPDQFAAMVPVSCGDYISEKEVESFRNIKIWALHGDKDTHPGLATYRSDVEKTIKPLENAGIDIDFTTLEGKDHDLQDTIVDEKFTNKDGLEINPIVWALMQSKA